MMLSVKDYAVAPHTEGIGLGNDPPPPKKWLTATGDIVGWRCVAEFSFFFLFVCQRSTHSAFFRKGAA